MKTTLAQRLKAIEPCSYRPAGANGDYVDRNAVDLKQLDLDTSKGQFLASSTQVVARKRRSSRSGEKVNLAEAKKVLKKVNFENFNQKQIQTLKLPVQQADSKAPIESRSTRSIKSLHESKS